MIGKIILTKDSKFERHKGFCLKDFTLYSFKINSLWERQAIFWIIHKHLNLFTSLPPSQTLTASRQNYCFWNICKVYKKRHIVSFFLNTFIKCLLFIFLLVTLKLFQVCWLKKWTYWFKMGEWHESNFKTRYKTKLISSSCLYYFVLNWTKKPFANYSVLVVLFENNACYNFDAHNLISSVIINGRWISIFSVDLTTLLSSSLRKATIQSGLLYFFVFHQVQTIMPPCETLAYNRIGCLKNQIKAYT